ncbi:beta-lactamase-like protein [Baffinella frigidus]|nr:beta-lactamase-like protein [Cryptophyta sp. CCMP2293]
MTDAAAAAAAAVAATAHVTLRPGGAKRSFPFQGDETLEFMPLGGGNEVGRSCCVMKFKGKTIMFDCGAHPGYKGEEALPFFDEVDAAEIDLLLVTHFHVDHAAAVPYFLTRTTFKGKVFMTYPTLAICKLVWSDYIKVSGVAENAQGSLFTEKDIQDAIAKITCIDYHQEVEHEGVRFWCYNAGHVLGACMFMVTIAGVRLLYTGDYSRQEDRHLMAAEMPTVKVHVLVVESTYGVQTHEPRRSREKRFVDAVVSTLQLGGRVLLPVFAIGRAQELLLLLDEYWRKNPELQRYPIVCLSGMAKRCIASYQTYINQMNNRIRHLNDIENPFEFRHIRYMTSLAEFEDNQPSVVMASPGMLQNGPSRSLFDKWCEYRNNAVVITGYCVQNTLAKDLLDAEPSTHTMGDGREVQLKIRVHYVSFSAHADFIQTSEFIDELSPGHIVLVHGEANMMASLKKQLLGKYGAHTGVGIWSPQNTETVKLTFHESKVAKVVGSIAADRPKEGGGLSGVVLHKNFQLTICSVDEMGQHAGLEVSHLLQRLHVPWQQPWSVLVYHLSKLFGVITTLKETDEKHETGTTQAGDETSPQGKKKGKGKNPRCLLSGSDASWDVTGRSTDASPISLPIHKHAAGVLDAVTVRKADVGVVEVEWFSIPINDRPPGRLASNPINDLVADSVLSVILQTLSSPAVAKAMAKAEGGATELSKIVRVMLEDRYGAANVSSGDHGVLNLSVDGHAVQVGEGGDTVACASPETQKKGG